MKRKILFGAGVYGKLALEKYGEEQVECFVDNNVEKCNTSVLGKKVISFEKLLEIHENYEVIVCTKYSNVIVEQLKKNNIGYTLFHSSNGLYYPTNELIVNPYMDTAYLDDSSQGIKQKIESIDKELEQLYSANEMFNHIELETVNRCNGKCSFCPVSVGNDTRDLKRMSDSLFKSIINQLGEINYSGRLALFSNNEPFLDPQIIEKHRYARTVVPNARMHLFTNGTLLSLDDFIQIMQYLDELVIDNYNQELKLIESVQKIADYCENKAEYRERVTIVLRKQDEILSNRGGDAPNRKGDISCIEAKCVLPFKQMIVRPDGMVSLCCNDPLGKNTLADLNKEPLVEAWFNARYSMIRKCLATIGRKGWEHCKNCDVLNIG